MASRFSGTTLEPPISLQRASTTPAAPSKHPHSPSPTAPQLARRNISFHVRARNYSEGHRMKWDEHAEARLQMAEMELKKAQKKWSERQEVWLEEVEALREMKHESERFYRRREKLMRLEGQWWKKEFGRKASIEEESEWSGKEDAEDEILLTPVANGSGPGLLEQGITTSFPISRPPRGTSTSVVTPEGSQNPSRKGSLVGNLLKGGIFKRRDSV